MSIRSVNVSNSRLTEGHTFPFRILKEVELSPGDAYFVMQDPMGYKILMPAGFYRDYGFAPGQVIQCRVDKINCNGQMFLEPKHPHYNEGEVYDFPVVSAGQRSNLLDEPETFFKVRDVLGRQWEVRSPRKDLPEPLPKVIPCLLERIKKGRLFLRLKGEGYSTSTLRLGEWYAFSIEDERFNPDDRHSYFILSGPDGQKHLLKKKYYIHYGFHPGKNITCRVEKFSSEGYFILEPEHPCYVPGREYDFRIGRMEELVFSDGFRQKVLVLFDCFDEEVKVHVDDAMLPMLEGLRQVKALVLRIRKSRPELELSFPRTI
jgi:hypothetical protein